MTKITLSHSGKQHSYLEALCLKELGLLDRYFTSSYVTSKFLQDFINRKNIGYFKKRFIDNLYGNDVKSAWRFEFKEIIFRKIFGKTYKSQMAVYQRDVNFDEYMAKQITKRNSDIFWGFQGSCFSSLVSAKNNGKTAIVELATAHAKLAKDILGQEQKLCPNWADSIDNLVFPKEYEKRLMEEPHRADYCFAASDFTKQSLIYDGIKEEKIKMLPLCFNHNLIDYNPNFLTKQNRKLKVLYCGTITQRKGVKYLLDAFEHLDRSNVELTFIGNVQGSGQEFFKHKNLYNYIPAINQESLFKTYKNYDVLILPTIFEGFGLVILEAMAAGLPVITTRHSFGFELIKDYQNGLLIEIRDSNAIKNAIEYYINLDDEQYFNQKIMAHNTAMNYDLNSFRNRIQNLIECLKPQL